MHVHRAYQISVTGKLANLADPLPVLGLMFVPTVGTPAAGSSFGTGEARNVGLLTFVSQIINVLAIFPQGHPLIVVPAMVLVTDTVRIANEEGAYLLFNTKVDHFTGSFVPHVADATFSTAALFVLGSLQLLPAM